MHAPSGFLPPFEIKMEGLSLGWALLLFSVLVIATVWYYILALPNLTKRRFVALVTLRCLLLAIFVGLATHPTLFITLNERVRGALLVLVDVSQSMNLKDHRTQPNDLSRAGIATGTLDPSGGVSQTLSDADGQKLANLSRFDLLQAVAANPKLNLWPRLEQKVDLSFFGLGHGLIDLGAPRPSDGESGRFDLNSVATFFKEMKATESETAVGDSIRDLMQERQGEPIAGVLLITDGANNTGSAPLDAAKLARENRVPLYIYGVGITTPIDISVSKLDGPSSIQVREKAIFTVQVKGIGVHNQNGTVVLKADGHQVDQKAISFSDESSHEVQLSYAPSALGTVALEASIVPVAGETVTTNNQSSLRVRVITEKIKVLMADQNPSWDFQYLLSMLQRDRRITPKAVLFDADPGLNSVPNSPYLETMPNTKTELYPYQVLILGDVDPANLNETRMKMIAQWVEKAGGGVIFRAGPKFDPAAYRGTPLEPLLPVTLTGNRSGSGLYNEPVHLALTTEGEVSSLLNLSTDQTANIALWAHFPGVDWTAFVGRARPGAQSLLADPSSSRRNAAGPMPVIAVQNYGLGKSVYVGIRETYRWRSTKGEKYFTRIWNQIIQTLAGPTVATPGTVRLKSNQYHYAVGDRITVEGAVYSSSFEPARDASLTGVIKIQPDAGPDKKIPPALVADLSLFSSPDRPGEYHGEMTATVAGSYSFTLSQDPTSPVQWDVSPAANLEESDIALNEVLLSQMADITNGRFLREEDLDKLPNMITSHAATLPVDRKIDLIFSPWILAIMLLLLSLEWLLRRLAKLK